MNPTGLDWFIVVLSLAHFAVSRPEVGSLLNLFTSLPAGTVNLLPDFGDWSLTLAILVIPLTVQWWSVARWRRPGA